MNARSFQGEKSLTEQDIYISLTYDALDATAHMARVKRPTAGAVVLFAGMSTSCLPRPLARCPSMVGHGADDTHRLSTRRPHLGCTRDSFNSKTVTHLSYSAYAPLALKSLLGICQHIKQAHHLVSVAVTHRLGMSTYIGPVRRPADAHRRPC